MATKMPRISACEQGECSFNSKGSCHAIAITVGDGNHHAMCDTAMIGAHKGGVAGETGGVGACKEGDCRFNRDYECTAKEVDVGIHAGEHDCADCLTYARK